VVLPALRGAHHFILVNHSPYQSEARFVIVSSPIQFDPTISSILTSIMITSSNSPFLRGAGRPIIRSVIYCTPRGFPGCPACEPNFFTCS
jgi:hypothetical protein